MPIIDLDELDSVKQATKNMKKAASLRSKHINSQGQEIYNPFNSANTLKFSIQEVEEVDSQQSKDGVDKHQTKEVKPFSQF